RRHRRVVRLVLGQRLQGSDRVHADPSGAAGAFPLQRSRRRGSMNGEPLSIERVEKTGRILSRRQLGLIALAAAVPLLAVLPLPDFWITQLNYIGLYSLT